MKDELPLCVYAWFYFDYFSFAAGCRAYLPAPLPPPLLVGEAGELKLPLTVKGIVRCLETAPP